MSSASLALINGPWLACVFAAFGLLPGTWLVRALRLPPVFWTPMVFATASALAYVGFWLAFFSHGYADWFGSLLLVVSVAGFLLLLLSTDAGRALRQRDAWLPMVLMLALTGAYLANLGWAGVTSTYRFTITMPPEDNAIPLLLAEQLFYPRNDGRRPPPVTTVGLIVAGSDRPPLQAGVVATTRSLGLMPRRGYVDHRTYQVLGTVCQMVWLPTIYALARVLGLRRRQIALVLLAAACSGVFLLNALYTWPKLYAAWLFLLALALIIHAGRQRPADRSWRLWSTIGGIGALALLAHGSAIFSVIALPVFLLLPDVRRVIRPSTVAAAAVTGLLFLTPWTMYQSLYDPPGNRLTKMHLAGVPYGDDNVAHEDDRSTFQAIVDAYRTLTPRAYLHTRWTNLRVQWADLDEGSGRSLAGWVQWQQFWHQLPALGPLLIGLAIFPIARWRRRRAAGRLAPAADPAMPEAVSDLVSVTTWYAIAAVVLWTVVLFSPGAAILQHGSLATTALLMLCGMVSLDTLPRAWSLALVCLHVLLFAVCWLPMETLAGGMPPTWHAPTGLLMAALFATFILLLRAIPETAAPTGDGRDRGHRNDRRDRLSLTVRPAG